MKRYAFVIKLVFTISFLVLGYFLVDIQSLFSAVEKADWTSMIVAFASVLLIRFLMAIRWKVFLDAHQIPIKLSESISVIFASGAVGFFSPGGILADVFKGHSAYQKEQDLATVASIVMFDKVIGIFSMILLVAISSIFLIYTSGPGDVKLLNIVAIASGSTIAVSLVSAVLLNIFGERLVEKLRGHSNKIAKIANKLMLAFLTVSGNHMLMFKVIVISFIMQLLRSVTFFFILQALGLAVALLSVIAYFPIVFMLMLLPVTIGGLGIREGATFILFQQFDVSLEMSVASGLLFYAIQTVIALMGLFVLLVSRRKEKQGVQTPTN